MLIFNNNNLRISIRIWTQTIMLLFGPTTKIFGQTIAGSDALFAILHEHHFFEAVACWEKTMWFVFLFANDLLSRTFLTLVEIIYAVSDPDMNVDKIVQTWFDGMWKNLIFLVDDWSTVGLYPKGNLDSENSLPCLIWHRLN